jgi:hypothetical protein
MRASVSVAVVAALALVVALPQARADIQKQAALDTLGLTTEEYDSILKERHGGDAPRMVSRDGSLKFLLSNDKHIGYQFKGGPTVNLDELPDSIDTTVDSVVDSMAFGFQVGEASALQAEASVLQASALDQTLNFLNSTIEAVARDSTSFMGESKNAREAQERKLTEANEDLAERIAADMKKQGETQAAALKTLTESVEDKVDSASQKADDAAAGVKALQANLGCITQQLAFNVEEGACCKAFEEYNAKTKKCEVTMGMSKGAPGKTCKHIYAATPKGVTREEGFYWINPGGVAPFEAWCTFKGDWKGATLALRKGSSVSGMENHINARNMPCNRDKPGPGNYCKMSDTQINALKSESDDKDAYIVLSYKSGGGADPTCIAFGSKSCNWRMDARGGPGNACTNTFVRNSGRYCSRNQNHQSYRGLDGYRCGNQNYNSNNPHYNAGLRVSAPTHPFVIFEHSGGTHYCGGWDTTWHHVELWVH